MTFFLEILNIKTSSLYENVILHFKTNLEFVFDGFIYLLQKVTEGRQKFKKSKNKINNKPPNSYLIEN